MPEQAHFDPAAVNARIAEFCERFDLEPPTLPVVKGSHATDPLVEWCAEVGASIEWIATGDVRSMAGHYRNARMREREMAPLVRQMTEAEKEAFTFALQAVLAGHINAEEAMQQLKAVRAA